MDYSPAAKHTFEHLLASPTQQPCLGGKTERPLKMVTFNLPFPVDVSLRAAASAAVLPYTMEPSIQ